MAHERTVSHLPFHEQGHQRLPGLSPLDDADWITRFPDLTGQLASRTQLIASSRDSVIGALPGSEPAAAELLDTLLAHLKATDGWEVGPRAVQCPGGTQVQCNHADPLGTIGQMVSEDFCLLEKPDQASEYILTAAVLCFPAYWRLANKLGKPLTGIHSPVPIYGDDLARRVNRVFEALSVGRSLLRFNWGLSPIAELHTPPEAKKHWPEITECGDLFLRSERQTLHRLPKTGAIAFGIRTTVSPLSGLSTKDAYAVKTALDAQNPEMIVYKGGPGLFDTAKRLLEARLRERTRSGPQTT